MVGRAPEVGVREGPDTWWSMLQPAAMEGRPRRGVTREGSRAAGIGKENSSCSGGGWGRTCRVGQAGGGKPRNSCNGPGNG